MMGCFYKETTPFNPDQAKRLHLLVMRECISRAVASGKVAGEDVSHLLAQAAVVGEKLKTMENN